MITSFIGKKFLIAGVGAAAFVSLGTVFASTAQAVTFVTDRTALGANDSVDWGSLGSEFTTVGSPFSITSSGGTNLDVSLSSGSFQRRDQSSGWSGNFAPGDALLWTQGNLGPLEIDFSTAVSGAGAQIQANQYGSFTGIIEAFDSLGSSLGSFNLAGLSSGSSDNSAIFLGISSDSANIDRLTFSLANGSSDFAINQLDLRSGSTPVPEPTSVLGILAFGALSAGSLLKRKQGRKVTVKF